MYVCVRNLNARGFTTQVANDVQIAFTNELLCHSGATAALSAALLCAGDCIAVSNPVLLRHGK